ncbi:DUF6984 family protein [Dysgonomonas termitidis]|uniref:DUF6984 family protein n=1 Tax=Dysgonomonas termitidis TaxID=1516126 RepID=A0ABV9KWD6_9BACT
MEQLISEEFMEYKRRPTVKEKKLIDILVQKSSIPYNKDWDKELMVRSMSDGGMGSLYLYPKDCKDELRRFGKQISEVTFKDKDGVDVVVSLNTDDKGNLYELDIWKTDFNQLVEIPDNLEIV